MRRSVQFKEVRTPSGKKAFEAYSAICDSASTHVALCAPTLNLLEDAWKQLIGTDLDRENAQLVWIIKAEK